MLRKSFLKSISAAAALNAIPFQGAGIFKEPKSIIKPPKLNKGDTIGLVCPGSFISEEELKSSVENIEKLGFKAYYTTNILAKFGYFAGTDKQRADDINAMFSNKDIKGIMCARGGYGCARVLPLLDYDLIKKSPKIIVGYSDVTAILYGIFARTGLVCFHGPVGTSTYSDFSISYFNDVLVSPHNQLKFYNAKEDKDDQAYKAKTIAGGKGKGKLVGGNLSIVVSMLGTPYDIETDNNIIFLEDTGEEPYRIDRMLTQMTQAGKFDNASGIALGIFTDCIPKEKESGIYNSFTISEVLSERLSHFNIPVVYGMSFGHIANKFTIPIGIEAELDSNEQTLTLLEPAVKME